MLDRNTTSQQWYDDGSHNLELYQEALQDYVGPSIDYYQAARQKLALGGVNGITFNWSCAVFGPAWAASRHLWALCWGIAFFDVLVFIAMGRAVWLDPENVSESLLVSATAFLVLERIFFACVANPLLFRRFARWRSNQSIEAGTSVFVAGAVFSLIMAMSALLVYRYSFSDVASFIVKFPTDRNIALVSARAIDEFVLTLTVEFGAFFDAITAVMRSILKGLKTLFIGIPGPLWQR